MTWLAFFGKALLPPLLPSALPFSFLPFSFLPFSFLPFSFLPFSSLLPAPPAALPFSFLHGARGDSSPITLHQKTRLRAAEGGWGPDPDVPNGHKRSTTIGMGPAKGSPPAAGRQQRDGLAPEASSSLVG